MVARKYPKARLETESPCRKAGSALKVSRYDRPRVDRQRDRSALQLLYSGVGAIAARTTVHCNRSILPRRGDVDCPARMADPSLDNWQSQLELRKSFRPRSSTDRTEIS